MISKRTIVGTGLFTFAILALGYAAFGFWTMMIFSSGFLTGYLLWLRFPGQPAFASFRIPFWLAFAAFFLHRVEEKVMGFFAALSAITQVPTPEITSWKVIALVLASVGGWLLIPALTKRGNPWGYYFAWTFFASMGITELAHYIFPFFTSGDYGYFPGMLSVLLLAPLAWWGIARLRSRELAPTRAI